MAAAERYDIIVVGGGHAGAEAAHAAARMGARTLLISMSLDALGKMSCNPAIGGIGKGQLVREIDALGGIMGIAADRSGIQFRMLNRSKGPAVWSPRAQNDRMEYAAEVRSLLESTPNLRMRADTVVDLVVEQGRVRGVVTLWGAEFTAGAVILTSGTFLNGQIHVGERRSGGGRMGEGASVGLTAVLQAHGFETGRLKTGTPPRIDGASVDYSSLEEQPGEPHASPFSYLSDGVTENQVSCWLTYTDPAVHGILRTGFDRSPMFAGRIQGRGPRYCPSIEDKIDRFADRDRHQLFLEPEGRRTQEVYVNGFSTSLPEEVQLAALRRVRGLENVHLLRPGYAIEYDYFPPHQLKYSLETKRIAGLFFAGQVNGTTGYEEAAAQGIVAGINAVQFLQGAEPVVFRRSEAYIGVLIDDLVAKGTEEPYRVFTSRAEHRILLRQDNADFRLTERGHALGLAGTERLNRMKARREALVRMREAFSRRSVSPERVNAYLASVGTTPIAEPERLVRLALRPQVDMQALLEAASMSDLSDVRIGSESIARLAEVEIKYEGYLERERDLAERMASLESYRVPGDFDFTGVTALSLEAREKLARIRPDHLGQASRISGVSPADVSILMVLLKGARVSRETPGGDGITD